MDGATLNTILQLAADAIGIGKQLTAGAVTDAEAMQMLGTACNNVTASIANFNAAAQAKGDLNATTTTGPLPTPGATP